MNILIIEQPLNNRGDESAHRGLINQIISDYPQSKVKVLFYGRSQKEINEFRVISPNVEYVNIKLNDKYKLYFRRLIKLVMMLNIPYLLYLIPQMSNILRYIRHADFVMCAPGGMNMGGFQDWIHLAFLTLSKMENKRIVYFARSIGPFSSGNYKSRLFKRQSLKLLRYFDYISLRDFKSQQIAYSMDIPFIPTIDSAFLSDTKVVIPQDFLSEIGDSSYLVFVPNSLAWHKSFKKYTFIDIQNFWVELLNALLSEYPDSKIVMLPQTIGYSTLLPDGFRYFCEIKNLCIDSERVVVLDEKYGSDVQQAIIFQSKLLIGARYHSIIFAINQSVPFISLSYEHKMNGVVKLLGKEESQIDLVRIFDGTPISELIIQGDIIKRIIQLSHQISADVVARNKAKSIALNGFNELKKYFHSTMLF